MKRQPRTAMKSAEKPRKNDWNPNLNPKWSRNAATFASLHCVGLHKRRWNYLWLRLTLTRPQPHPCLLHPCKPPVTRPNYPSFSVE